jgi:hypothetical protein
MLAEADRQLLTAYVDGELSARQSRQVLKLLRRSPAARRLLRQLQADSRELRGLNTPALGFDLSDTVVDAILHRRLRPRRDPEPEPTVSRPAVWASYAAAAAVLLCVGVASYLAFSAVVGRGDSANQANQQPGPGEPGPDGAPAVDGIAKEAKAPPEKGPREGDKGPRPGPNDVAVKEPIKPKGPKFGPDYDPDRIDPDLALTERFSEMIEFQKAPEGPPALIVLHDLEQEAVRLKLQRELSKGGGLHLDLPCTNAGKALERLRAACKAEQLGLTLDAAAAAKLKAHNFAVFLEDLTPEELTRLFQDLGADDKKAAAKRDAQFVALYVYRMGDKDHKDLSRLLGVDPTASAPRPSPPAVDIRKPLSDQTVGQLNPRTSGARLALVLPYRPGQVRPAPDEVKRFLAGRKPPRPGTLQVLLFLREAQS